MSEFCIKSAIEVAIKKEIEVPDENTGEIFYESSACLVGEDEFGAKSVKVGPPSDKQLELINSKSLEPQLKENWMILSNINPIGVAAEKDAHYESFDKAAERDMAKQAFWGPVLKNHDHDMNPPIGRCLSATVGKEGLRETWAIPIASYNAEYREAMMQGNMPEISVGAFIAAGDRICDSCGDKSIYNIECSHMPGRLDPKTGKLNTVTIKRVKRYAERSLVNIPARMGTSVKSMDQAPDSYSKDMESNYDHLKEVIEDLIKVTSQSSKSADQFISSVVGIVETLKEETLKMPPVFVQVTKKLGASDPPKVYDLPYDYDEVYLQILVPEGKDLTGANGLGAQNFVTDNPSRAFKFKDTAIAKSYLFHTQKGDSFVPQLKIDHNLFPDNESVNEGNFVLTVYCSRKELAPTPPATIPDVINEDSIVAEKDVKAPEAQEPSEKEENIAPEAPAAEDKVEAPAPETVKETVEVPVVKSLEVEELTKSFAESMKAENEELKKTLTEANEAIKSFKELQDGQGAQLKTLVDAVTSLVEQVAKLAEFSTEEAVTKLLEVAGQIKEQTAPVAKKAPESVQDVLDMLRK